MDDSKLCITVPQAARSLCISPAKAYLLALSGELPTIKFGRAVRVPVDELKRWVTASATGMMTPYSATESKSE